MKKSLQIISGIKLGAIIAQKVAGMDEFAEYINWSRQYINRIGKREKVKVDQERLEKIKNRLNITLDEIAYVPRETKGKQNSNLETSFPVSASILEELENCRKDVNYWKGLAKEYEAELSKLRGKQQ